MGVAVSGGGDSVALLHLLLELRQELGIVLCVVHFNHKLRGAESDADQAFVETLAQERALEFICDSEDTGAQASQEHIGIEQAARNVRYGFFSSLMENDSGTSAPALTKIATGHTLDDQAETVLMRLVRGTGLRGLGAIHPRIAVEDENDEICGEIVRPLLGVRRQELQQYLAEIKQPWREDSSNADDRFTRNRMRQLVLPLLEQQFNPRVTESLAELAEIARGEEDYWENEAAGWLGTTVQWSEPAWAKAENSLVQIGSGAQTPEETDTGIPAVEIPAINASVSRPWLLTEPLAVQRRVIKAIAEQLSIPVDFKHIEEALRFAAEDGPPGKKVSFPLGWTISREAEAIVFNTPDPRKPESTTEKYEYEFHWPGSVPVPEIGVTFDAIRVNPESETSGYNPSHLLNAEALPKQLRVRNWRAGDRFWPAHSKSPKKVKELLQDLHVAGHTERKLWPVIDDGERIVWMRGFPAHAEMRPQPGSDALLIRELPSQDSDLK